MSTTLGKYLSSVKTLRAAVIPYIFLDQKLFFLLARDRACGDITDIGGGVKKYECSLSGCIREFKEETSGIYGSLYNNFDNFSRDVAVYTKNMSVLFISFPQWILQKTKEFSPNSEISELIWIDELEFIKLINPHIKTNTPMWKKIQPFYKRIYTQSLSKKLRKEYTNGVKIKTFLLYHV